jgi:predicted nucleic acid-binding protein
MAILVDTSTVIAVSGNEPSKPRLIELTRGEELVAALTLPWEVGNAVSAMFKQRRVDLAQGMELIKQYYEIPIRLEGVSMEDSVKLAAALNIYAYDAYVIECAREHRLKLLTLDVGLKEAAKRVGVDVLEVNS